MSSLAMLKEHKREIIQRYGRASDARAWWETLSTLVPLGLLWWVAVQGWAISAWITAGAVVLLALLNMRMLVLLHECGHGSLFRSQRLNRAIGFLWGALTGMPQYVWSQNHNYHHATNGNWEKFRGPLTSPSTEEYAAMGPQRQRLYRRTRNMALAPLAGFAYLIYNPRINWIKGSLGLLRHLRQARREQPGVALKVLAQGYKSRYWKSWREYQHMSWNNLALLAMWSGMVAWLGAGMFFGIFLTSVSLAGGGGIALFTVQHNFEHSYAADTANWDYDRGALHGTSFLQLPGWLNWFTADIAYHHVHHLSTRIPSYRLADCHRAYAHLFTEVPRVTLWQIPGALKYLLWDRASQRMISFDEFDATRGVQT